MGDLSDKKNQIPRIALYSLVVVVVLVLGTGGYLYYKFREAVQQSDEVVLRINLKYMRAKLKEYTTDKGKPPQSLTELVSTGYLNSIPEDPITKKPEWQVNYGQPKPGSTSGIVDVHSWSPKISSEGTPYSQW
jgi:general secretion pathway protein G